MKMVVKSKGKIMAHKPGNLIASHIRYAPDGSASVEHHYEPEPAKPNQMWQPPPKDERHFDDRMAAHHHAAQHAGLNTTIDDEDEDLNSEGGDNTYQAPGENKPGSVQGGGGRSMAGGGGTAGKGGLGPVR